MRSRTVYFCFFISYSKALTSECRTLKSVSIMNSPFLSDASFKCLSLCKRLRKIRVEGKLNESIFLFENVFLSVSSLVIKQLRMSQVRLMLIHHRLLTANLCLQLTARNYPCKGNYSGRVDSFFITPWRLFRCLWARPLRILCQAITCSVKIRFFYSWRPKSQIKYLTVTQVTNKWLSDQI